MIICIDDEVPCLRIESLIAFDNLSSEFCRIEGGYLTNQCRENTYETTP
jgi:hypothetical protein